MALEVFDVICLLSMMSFWGTLSGKKTLKAFRWKLLIEITSNMFVLAPII